ncbi:hypothetical protein BEP19_14805 [Ammoniphilus oxalaticus]|uniref:Uncharacterized protein n=1 Tax=Ammoniphilus oxalaticus TaxID=66863 RepID=A0A419SE91_9BACL|nr:hypothetical protein [Ammoniphilus oxalaticus]RKD21488.1 hypothetical protein BEP19_14805 [Ammoniphilus oxalaticus]
MWDWKIFAELTRELIDKLFREKGFYNLYDDGKVASVSGRFASVYINGATVATPDIPIRQGVSVSVGDEVRVLNVNFNKRDRIVDHKKIM